MSNGPPPTNIYSFDLGMGSLSSLPDVNAPHQMAADQQETADVMSLINTAMFDDFGAGPMNLDTPDNSALSQAFLPPTTATPRAASGITAAGLDSDANASSSRARTNSASGRDTSTLTDFTKRRNWAAKLGEDIRDLLVVLDRNAKLMFVSPSVQSLLGYTSDEVIDKFMKEFIHSDDAVLFDAEMNAAAATGQSFRVFCRLKKSDGTYGIFETMGHAHIANEMFDNSPNIMNKTPFCQAVFMMLRPYPTKNAALLDSMLEHKIENERLKRKIAELTREEAVDKEEAIRQSLQSQEGRSDVAASEDNSRIAPSSAGAVPAFQAPINSQPASSSALTRENLEGIAGSRPDSLRDKMARYEGASHTDTIEMLTGLRYVEGERSRGITTGDRSPTLITGDAGIAIPADRDPRTGEKMKKKQKIVEEYVCTDCGTLDSPEWRKGPHGPKTLCNACGLRWAKKEKKRNSLTGPPGPADETSTSRHIGNNENKV